MKRMLFLFCAGCQIGKTIKASNHLVCQNAFFSKRDVFFNLALHEPEACPLNAGPVNNKEQCFRSWMKPLVDVFHRVRSESEQLEQLPSLFPCRVFKSTSVSLISLFPVCS